MEKLNEKYQKRLEKSEPEKKAAGGPVRYTPQEEMLLRKYGKGGVVSNPTMPSEEPEGEERSSVARFLESAARELPSAMLENVRGYSDLAAKYLKWKFGAMPVEDQVAFAKALPEGLRQAAVNTIQSAKDLPEKVRTATPEQAGEFAGQFAAGELTDPFRVGRAARAVTKPVISEMGDVSSIEKFKSKKLADELEKKISNKNWLFKPEKTNSEIAAELAKVRNQSALNEYIDLSFSKTPPHTEERYSEIYRLEKLQKELKPDLSPEVYEMLAKGRRISKAEQTPAPAAKPIEKPQPKESGVYELGTGRKIAETYDLDDIPESPFKELVQKEHAAATKLLKIKDQSLIDRYINLQKEKEKFSFDDDRRLDIEDEIDSISAKLYKDLDESSSHLLYDTSTAFDNSKEFRKFLNLTPQQRLKAFEKLFK